MFDRYLYLKFFACSWFLGKNSFIISYKRQVHNIMKKISIKYMY